MNILHINCNYIGTALHQNLIRELSKMGVKSRVFAPVYSTSNASITPDENVVVSKCFKKWDRLVFDYKQSKIFRAADETCKAEKFDCIHAYTLFTDGNCARNLSKKYNIPYVVAVRNTDVNSFFKIMPHLRGRGIKIMRDAKAVFFLSEAYRKQVFEKYVPEKYKEELSEKTYIIPNGIDDFWFENSQNKASETVPEKDIKIVFAGRIDKNKNVPTIQKAIKLLEKRGFNTKLTVVGRPADKKEFEIIKADKNTICVPAKPKEELIQIYRENDIFVMPSFTETFGLVYVEAISQGLPVVYSAGQGFDGQFAEGEVGFRADAKSAESVADAIVKVIENYDTISKDLAQKAEKYKWSSICPEYIEIYKAVCR